MVLSIYRRHQLGNPQGVCSCLPEVCYFAWPPRLASGMSAVVYSFYCTQESKISAQKYLKLHYKPAQPKSMFDSADDKNALINFFQAIYY